MIANYNAEVAINKMSARVRQWSGHVDFALGMLGITSNAIVRHAVLVLIDGESSGDPRAINLWDSNARAGHPSTGLIQTIQSTFDAYKSSALRDDIDDPLADIYAGLNCSIDRYGSIENIPGIKSVLAGGGSVGYEAAARNLG